MLKDAIEKSRSLSHELGPAVLAQSSLDDTFEWLARQMESQHGLVVHVHTRGRTESYSEPVRSFLYRAAREILFNVVKHARVSEAQLRLHCVRDQLRLTISDKGRGFDLQVLVETSGFGLLSVRERVEFLGGRMKIKSRPGQRQHVPDRGPRRRGCPRAGVDPGHTGIVGTASEPTGRFRGRSRLDLCAR